MKTRTKDWTRAAWAAAIWAAAGLAQGPEAEPPRIWVLDPKLPAGMRAELETRVLKELASMVEETLAGEAKVRLDMASGTVVVKGGTAARDKATELIERLRAGVLADPDRAEGRLSGGPVLRRYGQPVGIRVQVVIASRKEGPTGALPAAVEKGLAEALGFRSFRLAAETAAEGLVGDDMHIQTEIPWAEKRRMGLDFKFHPSIDKSGRPSVKADLRVFETSEKEVAPPLKATIQTTYRPQAGLPTAVGTSPLSEAEALVFVVHHQGAGIE